MPIINPSNKSKSNSNIKSQEIESITIDSNTSNINKNIEKNVAVEDYDINFDLSNKSTSSYTIPSYSPKEIETFIEEETELINSEITFYEEQIKQNEELIEKLKYLQERTHFLEEEKRSIAVQYQYEYPDKNLDEIYELVLKDHKELNITCLEELETLRKELDLDELTLEKIKDFQTYEEFQTFIEEIENDIACFNSGIYKYNSYLKTLEYRYLNYNEDFQKYQIKDYEITKDNLIEVTYGNGSQAFKFSYSSYCKKFGYVDEFSFIASVQKYFPESKGLITINDELLTIEAMAKDGDEEYKKMYLYLYEKEGEKSAQEFLNAIQDEINNYGGKLKADEFLKNLEENPDKATEYINNYLAEVYKGTNDGIFNWIENVKNTIDVMFDNDDAYVYSMHEYETMYILQALKEKDYGLADENVYEISQSVGNMVPSIVISSVTGCPTLGAVSMGVPAGGSAAHQGLVEGYSRGQSITYGVLTGVSETCLERFLGGITGIGDVNVTSLKTLLQSMGKESVEESTQSYLDSAFRTGIFKEDYDFVGTSNDAFKSGIYGAISGGIINSAMAGINYGINKDSNIETNISSEINTIESIPFEALESILTEDGYIYLGHGTGRNGNSNDLVNTIFKEGLRTKDNSLYYTTLGLSVPSQKLISQYQELGIDVPTMQTLQEQLNNWSHLDSKKIILMKIPIEYINELADSGDLGGERYGAFMLQKTDENGKVTNYLDPKFIIGCYDVETETVILNKSFEKELSPATKNELEEKVTDLRNKVRERNNTFDILANEEVIEQEQYDGPVDEWGFPILGSLNEKESLTFDNSLDDFDWGLPETKINEDVSNILNDNVLTTMNQTVETVATIGVEVTENVNNLNKNIENTTNELSNFINEKGLIDVKILPLSSKEDVRIVQEKILNNEPLSLSERLKIRDSAVTTLDNVELYSDHMYRATSYNALLDYINSNAIRDNGQGKGFSAVNWYLGGTAKRYGKVIIETPANPNLFQLSDDYGGFLSGNPKVRQAHSSNENPVSFDKVTRIIFLDETGEKVLKVVEPNNSPNLIKEVELGNMLYEQDKLLKIKDKLGDSFDDERQQQLDEINKKIKKFI